jgi:hypothetical protein
MVLKYHFYKKYPFNTISADARTPPDPTPDRVKFGHRGHAERGIMTA